MIFDILVFDGVDELDAFGALEVLRRAQHARDDVTVRGMEYSRFRLPKAP